MNDSMTQQATQDIPNPYRDLVESAPVGLYRIDPAGTFIQINPAMVELLGYPDMETLQDINLSELYVDPRDHQHCQKLLTNGGVVKNLEAKLKRFNGQPIWVENNLQAVYGADEQVAFYDGCLQNTNKHVETELKLRQRNRELGLLNQAGRTLSSSLDLDEVLSTILEEVRHLLDAVACSVWLIDSQPNVLVCFQATAPRKDIVMGWRMKIGQGFVGMVAESGQSLVVRDARTDTRHFKRVDNLTGLKTRSVLGVPLKAKGLVIGVLQVIDAQPNRFQETDLMLLEPLAASAASAIENAKLYESLMHERNFASAILDTAGALIIVLEPNGHVVRFNPACEQTTGYTFKEMHRQPIWDKLIPPEEREAVKSVFENLRNGRFPNQHENHWLTKSGEKRQIVWSNTVLFDADQNVEYVIGTGIDITERRQMEVALLEAIEESDRRNAEVLALLEGSRAVLKVQEFENTAKTILNLCKDLVGATMGYVALTNNDAVEQVLFLDPAASKDNLDTSPPIPISGLCLEIYGNGKKPFNNNLANTKWAKSLSKGKLSIENILCSPLTEEGQVVGWLGLLNKPTDFNPDDVRMAAAFSELAAIALVNSQNLESLEESEQRFRSVVETANDAIITIDQQGIIRFWNPAAEELFGYPTAEAIGQPLTMVMPNRFAPGHQEAVQRIITTEESSMVGSTVKTTGVRRGGEEFSIELSLAHWKTQKGDFFTGIVRDVTKRTLEINA